MATLEKRARDSLQKLIEHVYSQSNGLIVPLTYEELASRIGRLKKSATGHGRGIGAILGKMGHIIGRLEDEWGGPIPHIQSLVVNKTGVLKGLPDVGIQELWPDYPAMSQSEIDMHHPRKL